MIKHYQAWKKRLITLFLAPPKSIDIFLLAILTILVAYQPFGTVYPCLFNVSVWRERRSSIHIFLRRNTDHSYIGHLYR